MPPIQFEDIGSSLSRIPQLIQSIPDIIRNPAANPLQAALLVGIALVLALVVLLSILIMIMNPDREERELLSEQAQELSEEEAAQAASAETAQRRGAWLTVTSILILVGLVVWVAAGITSATSEVCTSCHASTSHTAAAAEDPHRSVACVDCHEGGGVVARATVNVFTRVQHVVLARVQPEAAKEFGKPVASDKCAWCHRQVLAETYVDNELKVRVSHREPLDAGAQCVDCHTLQSGTVTAATVGMSPCLRCHDGKQAKAECTTCHIGDPSQSIRPSVAPQNMASAQVPNPECGGCHKDMTSCTACHGIEMPHSSVFRAYGHARPGALDIWENNLKTCSKCHYSGHNACQGGGCHSGSFPAHPSPSWRKYHSLSSWSDSSITCPCHQWNPYDHNGMLFCQICHTVKPKGARR